MVLERNPFTPSFGQVPLYMAGRDILIDDILRALENGVGDPNLSTIFVGARGTGKTALLSLISDEATSRGWISVNVSAIPGMLDDIVQRTLEAASEFLDKEGDARIKGVSVGNVFGVEWEHRSKPAGNWRTQMNSLFKQLEAYDIGLLLTIDEVRIDFDEMVQLASTYQHFIREGKKVALMMAGLPHNVSALLSNESVSFLRRAQCHHFGKIEDFEIEEAFRNTVNNSGRTIDDEAVNLAVERIGGFPYMMQLVGYRMWAANPLNKNITVQDARVGVDRASRELKARVLEATFRELSDGDVRFLRAMLPDEEESVLADIAARMGVKTNYAAQYRMRLLEQGIIGERGRGVVGFDIPLFREFLQEKFD